MANISSLVLLASLLLTLSVVSFPLITSARSANHRHLRTVSAETLLPSRTCTVAKGVSNIVQGKSVLKLVHRHGPCNSLFGRASGETAQVFKETVEQDRLRVDWINSRIPSSSSSHNRQLPRDLSQTEGAITAARMYQGRPLNSDNFIVAVGLGTPTKKFFLSFDTGSDVNWVQCEPCSSCYPQQGPRYDPSASSTYEPLSCSSPDCPSPEDCAVSDKCPYKIGYLDHSISEGYLSRDILTMTPTDKIPGLIFGCGQMNHGIIGMTGGMLAFGRSNLSFVYQTANQYGNVFAYCLPTVSTEGYLALGPDPSYASAQFTAILPGSQPFYYLTVTGMSLNGEPLSTSSSSFAKSGAFIDSGTVISRLPPAVYYELRSGFRTLMSQYPLAEPGGVFDTCYDFSDYPTYDHPSVTLSIQGGIDLVLGSANIFYPLYWNTSRMCLAFAPTVDESSLAIIGSWQQKGTLLIHDIPNGRIGFKPGACNN